MFRCNGWPCGHGTNFVNLRDAGDPIELGKRYNDEGADELVFLDITASSNKEYVLASLIENTAKQIFIPLTIGGGINSVNMIRTMLNAGADKLSINTAAIHNPELVQDSSQAFGLRIVVAIDARQLQANHSTNDHPQYDINPSVQIDPTSQWEIYTHGGRNRTGIDAVKWAKFMNECGAGELLVTSMDADGTKNDMIFHLHKQSLKLSIFPSSHQVALELVSIFLTYYTTVMPHF